MLGIKLSRQGDYSVDRGMDPKQRSQALSFDILFCNFVFRFYSDIFINFVFSTFLSLMTISVLTRFYNLNFCILSIGIFLKFNLHVRNNDCRTNSALIFFFFGFFLNKASLHFFMILFVALVLFQFFSCWLRDQKSIFLKITKTNIFSSSF